MVPMGGAPLAPGARGDAERRTTTDWRLTEDDTDIFAPGTAPTDDGVLA
jgi:hypothetical protein